MYILTLDFLHNRPTNTQVQLLAVLTVSTLYLPAGPGLEYPAWTSKVLSLLLDPTKVLEKVLGPPEAEEQLRAQQSMLRRKTRLVECFCYLLCWEV